MNAKRFRTPSTEIYGREIRLPPLLEDETAQEHPKRKAPSLLSPCNPRSQDWNNQQPIAPTSRWNTTTSEAHIWYPTLSPKEYCFLHFITAYKGPYQSCIKQTLYLTFNPSTPHPLQARLPRTARTPTWIPSSHPDTTMPNTFPAPTTWLASNTRTKTVTVFQVLSHWREKQITHHAPHHSS